MRQKMAKLVPLAEVLPQAFKKGSLDKKIQRIDLESRWEELVGRSVAGRCAPLKIVGKKLMISVEGSSWAHELSFLKETLLERIRTELPHLEIEEIRFQIED